MTIAEARWIASSEYKIKRRKAPVTVRLAEPVRDNGAYRCEFEILGLEQGDIRNRALGADGVQSLYLAMKSVSMYLELSAEYEDGRFDVRPSGELHLPRFDVMKDG